MKSGFSSFLHAASLRRQGGLERAGKPTKNLNYCLNGIIEKMEARWETDRPKNGRKKGGQVRVSPVSRRALILSKAVSINASLRT